MPHSPTVKLQSTRDPHWDECSWSHTSELLVLTTKYSPPGSAGSLKYFRSWPFRSLFITDSRSLQWTNKTGNMAFRKKGDSAPFIFISWCFVRSSMLFQAESEKASHYLPVSMGQHRFWCKTTGRRRYPADSIAAQYDLYMEHNQ